MNLYVFVFLFVFLFSDSKSNKVILLSHKWCRKTDKAESIFNKLMLQSKFDNVQFKIVQKSQELQNKFSNIELKKMLQQLNLNNLSQIVRFPYPSIYFSCQNFKGFYQNELTFTELSYWTEIYCSQLTQLPKCSLTNSQQYKFQFPQYFWKNITSLNKKAQIQFLMTNPQIKICTNKITQTKIQSDNQVQTNELEVIRFQKSKISYNQLRKIPFQPLFFKKFNHNIRNYMILHDKIAIMMIYTQLNNFKIKDFQQIYKSVMTEKSLMNQELRKKRDEYPFVYQIQKQNKQKIIFISTCYNPEQPSKCINKNTNKTGRHQNSKHKTIRTLLNFMSLKNYFQLSHSKQLIFAFRFNNVTDSIQKYIYDSSSHKLGNQFLFWIDWIFKRKQNKNQHELIHTKDLCLKNQIVHKYDPRDLKSISLNVKLIQNYQRIYKQIQITSIQSRQHTSYIFKVCKKNKQPFYTNSYDEVFTYNFQTLIQSNQTEIQNNQAQIQNNQAQIQNNFLIEKQL